MAKRKNVVITVISVILVVALIAVIIGVVYWLTDGFKSNVKTFAVNINGKTIIEDTDGQILQNGSRIEMIAPLADECQVKIIAREARIDFGFRFGAETYTWNGEIANRDVTAGFDIAKTEGGVTLGYTDVKTIAGTVFGYSPDTFIMTGTPNGYIFGLEIISGASKLSVGFALDNMQWLEIDPGQVVFKAVTNDKIA